MFDIPHPNRHPGSLHDQVFKDLIGAFLPDFVTLVAPEAAAFLDLSRWGLLNKEIFTDWPSSSPAPSLWPGRWRRWHGPGL